MPAITDPQALAVAIEDAASLILRWGHGQMRQLPAAEIAMIVEALKAQRAEVAPPGLGEVCPLCKEVKPIPIIKGNL